MKLILNSFKLYCIIIIIKINYEESMKRRGGRDGEIEIGIDRNR